MKRDAAKNTAAVRNAATCGVGNAMFSSGAGGISIRSAQAEQSVSSDAERNPPQSVVASSQIVSWRFDGVRREARTYASTSASTTSAAVPTIGTYGCHCRNTMRLSRTRAPPRNSAAAQNAAASRRKRRSRIPLWNPSTNFFRPTAENVCAADAVCVDMARSFLCMGKGILVSGRQDSGCMRSFV